MDWLKPRQTFLESGTGTVSSAHLRRCMLADFSMCEVLLSCDPVPHKALDEHFARIEEHAQKVLFPVKALSVNHFMELIVDPPLREMFPSTFNYARTQAGKKAVEKSKKFLDTNEHTLVSDDDEDDDYDDDEDDDEYGSDSDSLLDSGSDENEEEDNEDDADGDNESDFDRYCVSMGYLSSLYQLCKQIESDAVAKRSSVITPKLVLLDNILKANKASEALKSELEDRLESESSEGIEEWTLQFVAKMYAFVKAQTSEASQCYRQFLGLNKMNME